MISFNVHKSTRLIQILVASLTLVFAQLAYSCGKPQPSCKQAVKEANGVCYNNKNAPKKFTEEYNRRKTATQLLFSTAQAAAGNGNVKNGGELLKPAGASLASTHTFHLQQCREFSQRCIKACTPKFKNRCLQLQPSFEDKARKACENAYATNRRKTMQGIANGNQISNGGGNLAGDSGG